MLIAVERSVHVPLPSEYVPQVNMRAGRIGLEPERRTDPMKRLIEFTDIGKCDAKVHECFRRIGPELDRLSIIGDRLVELVALLPVAHQRLHVA